MHKGNNFLIQVMFSSFNDFSSLLLWGSGLIRSGKERCVWHVTALSESPTHLRTEERSKSNWRSKFKPAVLSMRRKGWDLL